VQYFLLNFALVFIPHFIGSKFTKTLLLIQALSVSGGPVIVKSLHEIGETYKKTRAALKEDLPQILKAKSEIENLRARVSLLGDQLIQVKSDFKNGVIDLRTMQNKEDAIRSEISEIRASFLKIDAIQGGLVHFMSTVDANNLKIVVGQLYTCLLAGAATVSSQTAAVVTMGLNISRSFIEKVLLALKGFENNKGFETIEQVVANKSAWWKMASQCVAQASGVVFVYFLRRTASIVSACALGSKMLVESVEDVLDPFLVKASLPTLRDNPSIAATVQSGVLVYGVFSQLKPGSGKMPLLIKLLTAPMFFIETLIGTFLLKT
jgi:hypothetical protein